MKQDDQWSVSVEKAINGAVRHARRVVTAVVGGTVVLIGVVMLVTPGPAMVLIPAGLAILAIEFAWARRLLRRVRTEVENRVGGKDGNAENRGSSDDRREEENQDASG